MKHYKSMPEEALIKGFFTPDEAREVLSTLFRSKIHMHSLESFSTLVKAGYEPEEHKQRIKELSESLERLLNAVRLASDSNLNLRIDCAVKIGFVSTEQ